MGLFSITEKVKDVSANGLRTTLEFSLSDRFLSFIVTKDPCNKDIVRVGTILYQHFAFHKLFAKLIYRPISPVTKLYQYAKDRMVALTSEYHEVHYMLVTKNKNMIAWAQKQGQEIFDWDSVDQDDKFIYASKAFYKQDRKE